MKDIIKNNFGREYNLNTITEFMDGEIMQELFRNGYPEYNQDFFDHYCKLHREKYSVSFTFACKDPDMIITEHGRVYPADVVEGLMDSELTEKLQGLFDTRQEFYEQYCLEHKKKFGEEFEYSKPTPVV